MLYLTITDNFTFYKAMNITFYEIINTVIILKILLIHT